MKPKLPNICRCCKQIIFGKERHAIFCKECAKEWEMKRIRIYGRFWRAFKKKYEALEKK